MCVIRYIFLHINDYILWTVLLIIMVISYFKRKEIESKKDHKNRKIIDIMKYEKTMQDLREKKVDVYTLQYVKIIWCYCSQKSESPWKRGRSW